MSSSGNPARANPPESRSRIPPTGGRSDLMRIDVGDGRRAPSRTDRPPTSTEAKITSGSGAPRAGATVEITSRSFPHDVRGIPLERRPLSGRGRGELGASGEDLRALLGHRDRVLEVRGQRAVGGD